MTMQCSAPLLLQLRRKHFPSTLYLAVKLATTKHVLFCSSHTCRYARKHFPSTRYLDYAIGVEGYTLQKARVNSLVPAAMLANGVVQSAAGCCNREGVGARVVGTL